MLSLETKDTYILNYYGKFVREYSRRQFTFQKDALNACLGILKSFESHRFFKSGFFWAIPVDYMQNALLWWHGFEVDRRDGFPSWSWLGWKGHPITAVGFPRPEKNLVPFRAWALDHGRTLLLYENLSQEAAQSPARKSSCESTEDGLMRLEWMMRSESRQEFVLESIPGRTARLENLAEQILLLQGLWCRLQFKDSELDELRGDPSRLKDPLILNVNGVRSTVHYLDEATRDVLGQKTSHELMLVSFDHMEWKCSLNFVLLDLTTRTLTLAGIREEIPIVTRRGRITLSIDSSNFFSRSWRSLQRKGPPLGREMLQ